MFVIKNQLDGVDLNYEDNAAMEAGTAVPWLITMSKAMLDTFASGAPGEIFYISLASQAPYFMEGRYPQIYIALFNSSVRNGTGCDHIDFLNVQLYNQSTSSSSRLMAGLQVLLSSRLRRKEYPSTSCWLESH